MIFRAACAVPVLQLTTDKTRAHAFYDRLGFRPGHIGYKKPITKG